MTLNTFHLTSTSSRLQHINLYINQNKNTERNVMLQVYYVGI